MFNVRGVKEHPGLDKCAVIAGRHVERRRRRTRETSAEVWGWALYEHLAHRSGRIRFLRTSAETQAAASFILDNQPFQFGGRQKSRLRRQQKAVCAPAARPRTNIATCNAIAPRQSTLCCWDDSSAAGSSERTAALDCSCQERPRRVE